MIAKFCVRNRLAMKIVLLLFTVSFISPFQQANLIEWSASRKLLWEDFRAQPNPNSTNAALTSSSINIEFNYNNTGLRYTIKCRFDKNRSWGRIKNEHILAHEQGHFDIAELHARRLNKAMKNYVFNNKTVSKDVNAIYDSIMRLHNETQNLYDTETNYSRDFTTQEEWEKKIFNELKSMEPYARYGS